jgi:hypothetical protein
MPVEDASYFYDGYQIPGEKGDAIQLEGQTKTARVVRIDYAANKLVLDAPLEWTLGRASISRTQASARHGAFESK